MDGWMSYSREVSLCERGQDAIGRDWNWWNCLFTAWINEHGHSDITPGANKICMSKLQEANSPKVNLLTASSCKYKLCARAHQVSSTHFNSFPPSSHQKKVIHNSANQLVSDWNDRNDSSVTKIRPLWANTLSLRSSMRKVRSKQTASWASIFGFDWFYLKLMEPEAFQTLITLCIYSLVSAGLQTSRLDLFVECFASTLTNKIISTKFEFSIS